MLQKKVEILLLRDQRVRKVSWRVSWREMEEKEDSPEVSLSVVANFHTDIPSAAQDEQPPSEQFAQ